MSALRNTMYDLLELVLFPQVGSGAQILVYIGETRNSHSKIRIKSTSLNLRNSAEMLL